MNKIFAAVSALVALGLVVLSCVFVVDQRQFA
ncbi:MAG: hypothetical protein RJA17_632, partial [Pseudomonadota bacterium]